MTAARADQGQDLLHEATDLPTDARMVELAREIAALGEAAQDGR